MYLDPGKAAFIAAQTALMEVELQGMLAENQHRMNCGNSIAFGEEAFIELKNRFEPVIGYNAIVALSHEP